MVVKAFAYFIDHIIIYLCFCQLLFASSFSSVLQQHSLCYCHQCHHSFILRAIQAFQATPKRFMILQSYLARNFIFGSDIKVHVRLTHLCIVGFLLFSLRIGLGLNAVHRIFLLVLQIDYQYRSGVYWVSHRFFFSVKEK